MVELVALGEQITRRRKHLDFFPIALVNLLKSVKVSHKFQTIVQSRRQVESVSLAPKLTLDVTSLSR